MAEMYPEKQEAFDWIESNAQRLSDFDMEIWSYHEPAWREYRSAAAYVDLLRADGWDVEEGSGDMPTAFTANWGTSGPVIGSYAEYDAVPGNSQQAVPRRAPREGVHTWAAGHTDPHSMLGTATLTGMLAAKAVMEKHDISGSLRFHGEPAEKVCGSKPVHAAKGYYDGVSAYIAYHPHATNTAVWETHCGSYWSAVFIFECVEPEKWVDPSLMPPGASAHTTARCPGAIDALMLMYSNTKFTKEAMFPRTGSWTLNEFIMAGGDATSDNLPPRYSAIQYSWRSPTLGIQQQIYSVLENNARQAAEVTGCRVSVRWVTKTRVGLANNQMSDLTFRNLQLVGAPVMPDEAREFGRNIQKSLGLAPMENPFSASNEMLTDPRDHEAAIRLNLSAWQLNSTSDDYVEYTWHAPTVRLLTARPTLQAPDSHYTYPAWTYNALGGVAAAVDPGMFVAGKTIAATILDLITQPGELRLAWEEFNERTGGGYDGDKWVAPLLSDDFEPPVDLRWPEYIETPRGREWWIPTSNESAAERL